MYNADVALAAVAILGRSALKPFHQLFRFSLSIRTGDLPEDRCGTCLCLNSISDCGIESRLLLKNLDVRLMAEKISSFSPPATHLQHQNVKSLNF